MPQTTHRLTTLLSTFLLSVAGFMAQSVQADLSSAEFTNSLQQDFVRLPSNSNDPQNFDRKFTMGTADLDEIAFELPDGNLNAVADETPAHTVQFRHPLYMARTEVTQGQWLELMNTKPGPDSHWQRADWRQLPVVSISWELTQAFIAKLNKREPGKHYRLPTEAEWENAARAGSSGVRPFPLQQLDRHAWTLKNSGDHPQPVGTRPANAWQLHDLFGNAWEWVADRYQPDAYAQSNTLDPSGPETGDKRVRRGGSYHCPPHLVRSAYRAADTPNTRYSVLGFRLVASP